MTDWLFGPRRGLPHTPWSPTGAVVLLLSVVLVAAGLTGLVLFGIGSIADLPLHGTALVGMTLFYLLLVMGLVVSTRLTHNGTAANTLVLRSPGWRLWQYVAFGLITVVALIVLQQLLVYLTGLFTGERPDIARDLDPLRDLQPERPPILFLLVLLAVVMAPLAEEFVFRGLLFTALRNTRLGTLGSAIVLSAIFAVLHWGYSSQNLVALMGLGLLFAYIVWRTGSLWPAVVGHAANNLVAVMVLLTYSSPGPGG